MGEIAEIRSFEHNIGVSVHAQPVRPVQQTGQTGLHGSAWCLRRSTGQTGVQDRLDRSPVEMNIYVLTVHQPHNSNYFLQIWKPRCHDAWYKT